MKQNLLNEITRHRLFEHTESLISRASITPDDQGCQQYIIERLSLLDFNCIQLNINGVSNLIAKKGDGNTRIAFSGHTDVVTAGDHNDWLVPPFLLSILDDKVYGRGIADMKGGIASMLTAIEELDDSLDYENFSLYFLITSDEEGEAEFGSKEIVKYLDELGELPNYCIVGEPSASLHSGDTIKVGRRGSISGELIVSGKAGHVAYPQYAFNAAHCAAQVISRLESLEWDVGSNDFPGTSLQITAIDTGIWTDNIIPGQCKVSFNIRYSHMYSFEQLASLVLKVIEECVCSNFQYEINWLRPCSPYLTSDQKSKLISASEQAIYQNTKRFPKLSTSGGTSDGRFFASNNCDVVEVGLPNYSIHQVNESVLISDLFILKNIYKDLLSGLFR